MPAVFVIKRDDNGRFVFDIINRNRTIATSAPYTTKALLQNQISGINPDAVIDDQSLIRRPAANAKSAPVAKKAPVTKAPVAKKAPTKAPAAKKTPVRRARNTG